MDSLAFFSAPTKLGLDAHRPYLEHRRPGMGVPVNARADQIGDLFVQGAVDVITLIDSLEHFPEAEVLDVLQQAERIARRRVVVASPRGEFPQAGYDAFGLGGEEWQQHRSTWEPSDFLELGYRVIVVRGFHGPSNTTFIKSFGADHDPVDALVAWKNTANRGGPTEA